MSKIAVNGYVIDVPNGKFDFSPVLNFDRTRLEYIFDEKTGIYYYVRPKPPVDWGIWDGAIFTPKSAPWAKVGPVPKLICLSEPAPTSV